MFSVISVGYVMFSVMSVGYVMLSVMFRYFSNKYKSIAFSNFSIPNKSNLFLETHIQFDKVEKMSREMTLLQSDL